MNLTSTPATSSIRQLKGIVPKPSVPVSLDEMETAITEGANASVIDLDTNVLVRYFAQDATRSPA